MTDQLSRTVLASLPTGHLVASAVEADIPAIIVLLSDDPVASGRETDPSDPLYRRAFADIESDPRQLLVVLLDSSGVVVGTLQLTFIPGLSRAGATRALVEAVRVSSSRRGSGLGSMFIRWAIDYSRQRGAALIQLTTDKRRTDAHRFYRRLGFEESHVGMKLLL
ncbi:MAG: GNAT family N-acetyltransferase [Actinomycetota bacterium]|nr:GNAT family N-acetyltransferase [Actinomycetota bacterium]